MAHLLTHKDGRLKTGRVAVLVFFALLMVLSIAFKADKSVDHALVAVKHVFEPEKQKISPKKSRDIPDDAKKVKPAEAQRESVVQSESSRKEVKTQAQPVFVAKEEHEIKEAPPSKVDPPPQSTALTKEGGKEKRTENLDVPAKRTRLLAPSSPGKMNEKSKTKRSMGKKTAARDIRAETGNREITVKKDQYVRLFKSWQKAGRKNEGTDRVPLRVENLRDAYKVFQMKPVAVVQDRHFVDLIDGTRVAEESLNDYSSTVFLVDRPWEKWGEALASAGIGKGEKVEVRYYMYGFVKNAIYTRVNQAFSWCKRQGLISAETRAETVDVLGRAYVIRQQDGGRFGVFVPVTLDIQAGTRVDIDPACFNGQADVETLHSAGLL